MGTSATSAVARATAFVCLATSSGSSGLGSCAQPCLYHQLMKEAAQRAVECALCERQMCERTGLLDVIRNAHRSQGWQHKLQRRCMSHTGRGATSSDADPAATAAATSTAGGGRSRSSPRSPLLPQPTALLARSDRHCSSSRRCPVSTHAILDVFRDLSPSFRRHHQPSGVAPATHKCARHSAYTGKRHPALPKEPT